MAARLVSAFSFVLVQSWSLKERAFATLCLFLPHRTDLEREKDSKRVHLSCLTLLSSAQIRLNFPVFCVQLHLPHIKNAQSKNAKTESGVRMISDSARGDRSLFLPFCRDINDAFVSFDERNGSSTEPSSA